MNEGGIANYLLVILNSKWSNPSVVNMFSRLLVDCTEVQQLICSFVWSCGKHVFGSKLVILNLRNPKNQLQPVRPVGCFTSLKWTYVAAHQYADMIHMSGMCCRFGSACSPVWLPNAKQNFQIQQGRKILILNYLNNEKFFSLLSVFLAYIKSLLKTKQC